MFLDRFQPGFKRSALNRLQSLPAQSWWVEKAHFHQREVGAVSLVGGEESIGGVLQIPRCRFVAGLPAVGAEDGEELAGD